LTCAATTQESYQAGQARLLQLLESQRLHQQSRLGYAHAKGQRFMDTAQFFIALGSSADGSLPGRVRSAQY
jgi:outer membrane protein TolC